MLKTRTIFFILLFAECFGIIILGCSPGGNSIEVGSNASSIRNDTSSPVIFLVNPKSDVRIANRVFEQVPSIASTSDGKYVYVAFYSGGAAAGPGNYVTLSVSQDQGKTWMNDQLVIFPKKPSIRIFDPALWRDKEGQIHLFYASSKDSLLWDGKGGVNTISIYWDGAKINYSDPVKLTDGVMINKPIFLASENIELFSVYIDKPLVTDSIANFPKNGSFIFSYDYGESQASFALKPYSSIIVPDSIRIHDEPQLVEVNDKGEILAFVRTTKGIYYTRSTDYGKHWSNIVPFTASGPTTSSRSYIGRLQSGNLLLVSNNSATRNKMTAFLSKDGGKTWPYRLLLDGRENVSYPDADQSSDGDIHVVFDRDRTGAKDILYCRFTENDILNGRSDNIFKIKVNKTVNQ